MEKASCPYCKKSKALNKFPGGIVGSTKPCLRCAWIKRRLRNYSMTLEQFHALWESQNGLCVICERYLMSLSFVVDHRHKTGHVRGILCTRCNNALGLFKDNAEYLRRAACYVSENNSNPKNFGKFPERNRKAETPCDYWALQDG